MVAGHKARQNAVNFTGCLAHAEVTYMQSTQRIPHIHGYFHHNEGCKVALIARFPLVPLHLAVYQATLQQLKDGCILTDLQDHNCTMVEEVAYCGQLADLTNLPTDGISKERIHIPYIVSLTVCRASRSLNKLT